jgi:large subunit ribosomal protein L13
MEYHIDATNKVLGRLASDIAVILQGKKVASYERNHVGDDKVFVKNVNHIRITGNNKEKQKIYYHHTGYVGHLKELTYKQKFEKDPRSVLRQAVRKMLPKNFLNQQRIKNLVFVEEGARLAGNKKATAGAKPMTRARAAATASAK